MSATPTPMATAAPNAASAASTSRFRQYYALTKPRVTALVIATTAVGLAVAPVRALGLMLALSKKIGISDKAMRTIPNMDRRQYQGNDLKGKTVGIVGIGNIGSRVSDLCRGLFGMTVLVYDPYLTAAQVAARGGTQVGLEELMRRSDYVTVHCPRSKERFGMFGAEQYGWMKPTAYFINTARGGIHKEAELADALKAGKLAGAGLDVFLEEPTPLDNPLLALDNVIVTPHNAGMTDESLLEMCKATAEQWIGIFNGEVPPRLVNPEAWPLYSQRFAEIIGTTPAPLS